MKRILLLSTTTGYQAGAVLHAARELNMQVTLGTDRCHVLDDPWGDGALALRFEQPEQNAAIIAAQHAATPFDGLVAIGDAPAETAALAAQAVGIAFHTPQGARASRDKLLSRRILRDAGLLVPFFAEAPAEGPPADTPFPCVLKPGAMSASRGVIRADNPAEFRAAHRRISAMIPDQKQTAPSILVESFVPGRELALEGIVEHGRLHTLAIFDKPDPLDGPYFEETIYVTPSRLEFAAQQEIVRTVASACHALGLCHGPIHAEVRWNERGAWVLEVAARPIGGLCARALRFGGSTLETLILRHAAGDSIAEFTRDRNAAGVMMIPIPGAGVYAGVDGVESALAVPGVTGLEITAKAGERLIPWPEGSSYLGFIFAEGETPEEAERALRTAHERLKFAIHVSLPVVR
jgi:biotin carboxylase